MTAHTLLLTLSAPLQAWGAPAMGGRRPTLPHPSKSGVVGLLACCLGRDRDDWDDLMGLRFGTTLRPETRILTDFQTMGVTVKGDRMPVERREYIQDATFTAGVESDDMTLLEALWHAVGHPVYAPYLGRRSCPPAGPIHARIAEGRLEDLLPAGSLIDTPAGGMPDTLVPDGLEHGRRRLRPATLTDPYLSLIKEAQPACDSPS